MSVSRVYIEKQWKSSERPLMCLEIYMFNFGVIYLFKLCKKLQTVYTLLRKHKDKHFHPLTEKVFDCRGLTGTGQDKDI